MQFNNGTDSIVSDVRFWSGADANSYALADIVRNANRALDRVVSLIMRSDNSWEWDDVNQTDLPIATTNIVNGQQDYSIPITHLKVIRVRAKDTNGEWITLKPVSRRTLSDYDLARTGTPYSYDKLASSILLTPTPDYASTAGLEVQFQRPADYFTTDDTSQEPGFASLFHRLISLYCALDYTEPNDMEKRSATIRNRIERMEVELAEFYQSRDHDQAPNFRAQSEDYGQSAMT